MEEWDETAEKVNRIRPDKEKAKSLLKMTELRQQRIALTTLPVFATLVVEEYYEIIKELITGIMSIDGWKTVSHELLVGYIAKFYKEISSAEIALVDQLRVVRNDIGYRGTAVNPEYLQRNQERIKEIIGKLKSIVEGKLK